VFAVSPKKPNQATIGLPSMALHVVNVHLRDCPGRYAKQICWGVTCGNDISVLRFRQTVDQIDVLFADDEKSS
jgi:hypothetical protein